MDARIRREWRGFRRHVPFAVSMWSLGAVGMLLWRLLEGDPIEDAALLGLVTLAAGVLLIPLQWVRWERAGAAPAGITFKLLGLALLWAIAGGALIAVLFTVL